MPAGIMAPQEGIVAGIGREIETHLPREIQALLRVAGELASREGQRLYLVGGVVRDLLLGRRNLDIDLIVEGNAPALARQLAKAEGGKVVTHPRFGTATITENTISIDIVTARSETYARPGALPRVKPGTIRDDLYRRDFSVNAMAVKLHTAQFGELVDPFNGKNDLDNKLIKILHKDSFKDDPTRIWRAIRYEQRLNFKLGSETEHVLRHDLAFMYSVSGDRLRHELERILEEPAPEKAIRRAGELGALQMLQPYLKGDKWLSGRFEQARNVTPHPHDDIITYWALLVWRLEKDGIEEFIKRLRLKRESSKILRDITNLKRTLPSLDKREQMPSEIYRYLANYKPQAIQAASIATDSKLVRGRLLLYLSNLRLTAPILSGHDLQQMGVPPGRKLGRMLRDLKYARLDGKVATKTEEQELVLQWLSVNKR